ncbi:exosome complex component RRP4-like protein [Euroglyphus maynei]|uniref:Exosome complex component RRP4-like protein n=1 Tax=Euroglyphus maynei TaxID=6958 RepID=A0A1Y3BF97_EURMA|nr:exosome complex component RRP4-like protein [Euroglyphus maynei]
MATVDFFTFSEIRDQLDPIIIENDRVKKHKYVLPGDCITTDINFMRGHGTFHDDFLEEDSIDNDSNDNDGTIVEKRLVSSLAGIVEPINRLISVRPLRTRYVGAIGDVVVGRIIDVQQKRWKVETNSRLSSILQLSSVNLPGGELRRRTSEDELLMRNYLTKGDLICAEVQTIYDDGSLGLYTRSLKYGKLGQGLVVQVSPSMIAKRKIHTHNLPCGIYLVLGNNGLIFISISNSTSSSSGGFILDKSIIPYDQREKISRLRNCIIALSTNKIMLDYSSIVAAFEISEKLELDVYEILKPNVSRIVADQTRIHLLQSNLIEI